MVASAEGGNAFGQNILKLWAAWWDCFFWIPLMSREVCELAIWAEREPYKSL